MSKKRKIKKTAAPGRPSVNARKSKAVTRIDRHRDGSIRAKGKMIGGVLSGYWEWFRLDGTKLRSGFFDKGRQTGLWTTYDAKGKVYKVTETKPKSK